MASVTTRDHDQIREWAQQRGATPTMVSSTGGMLRFEFDPQAAAALTPINWDEFFHVFDEKGLELVYDDQPASRFHKFVFPETIAAKEHGEAPPTVRRRGAHVQAMPKRQSGKGQHKQREAVGEAEEEAVAEPAATQGSRSRRVTTMPSRTGTRATAGRAAGKGSSGRAPASKAGHVAGAGQPKRKAAAKTAAKRTSKTAVARAGKAKTTKTGSRGGRRAA